jgi:hypothetical protein
MIIPKHFVLVATSSDWSSIVTFIFLFDLVFLGPNTIKWVFAMFRDNLLDHNHWTSLGISSLICNWSWSIFGSETNKLESSAKSIADSILEKFGKSLI